MNPESLEELSQVVIDCIRCPRLIGYCRDVARTKKRMYQQDDYWGKPVPGFGDPLARILIVGLAPAASMPISRHRFDGLELCDVFITAIIRCAPPSNRPLLEEIENCTSFLHAELDLLKHVRIIIAVGKLAFDQMLKVLPQRGAVLPQPKPKFRHASVLNLGGDYPLLISSYHPSRQNTQTGRLTPGMLDDVFKIAVDNLALFSPT